MPEKLDLHPDRLAAPLFSIVIPVRNDEANLRRCLESLTRLESTTNEFEVIVVDNGSTDATRSAADSFLSRLPLRIVEKPGVYISAVRNAGAEVARGQYLAFLDSDCEAPPKWLSSASECIKVDLPTVFGCYYLIPDNSSWIARNWYDERDKKNTGKVSYLPAGNLFAARDLYQKLGGFDETIQTNEDYEFCQRASRYGSPVYCYPALGVVHWGTPQTLGSFFTKHRWHGMHVFRVFLRNLPALFNVKPVALALYTLFCVAFLAVGTVLLLLKGQFHIAAIALTASLLPPLLLGLLGAFRARKPIAVIPLAALYLVYAAARASSLLDLRNWISRV